MHTLKVRTQHRQHFVDLTSQIAELVQQSKIRQGYCHLFCPHTTAGLTFNENWDPDVQHDMALSFDKMAPQRSEFRHAEGNSPAHVKTSMVGSAHTLFIIDGQLLLGRWQGIYLAEFDGPRTRNVHVKVQPDSDS